MLQILELFAGIGGVAEAIRQHPQLGRIVQAVDIDGQAGAVYAHNFGQTPRVAAIESAKSWESKIAWREADTWWLSPPCQPYCRRGNQSENDPRRAAFQQVMLSLKQAADGRPRQIAMENVPEFRGTPDHQAWLELLRELQYEVCESVLCPTAWGLPNRRQRYYLTAIHSPANSLVHPPAAIPPPIPITLPPAKHRPLSGFLEKDPPLECWLAAGELDAKRPGLNIVDWENRDTACTACFTSGYGKSILQAGSYLQVDSRLRRFSPLEIARLLGFSDGFTWPEMAEPIRMRRKWKLLGNSLSIPVVRAVLSSLVRD